jgi:hypothetical protein
MAKAKNLPVPSKKGLRRNKKNGKHFGNCSQEGDVDVSCDNCS